MYYQFFGLQKEPFGMTPDPSFLFLSAAHREALAGLTYAILSRKGFVVLTGDAGTGKTTLLTRVLKSVPPSRASFSVVLNPTLTPAEFLELVLLDFGIAEVPASKAQRLTILREFLTEAYGQNRVSVLVVDEAHKLPPDVLEEIRLLSNFELPEGKLLQIVLAGQTGAGRLAQPAGSAAAQATGGGASGDSSAFSPGRGALHPTPLAAGGSQTGASVSTGGSADHRPVFAWNSANGECAL